MNTETILYPFSAIVGQDDLKKALLLCAINPAIGGVLIKGEKGTAKSTAVRGLVQVMPALASGGAAVPFVDLPLGVSEDRLLGSLDIEAILSGRTKKLLPGLLASAHEGILYIDEVNLLADHLVDVLLDVAASGINTVQREGLSVSHPARFVLIGTMNPEEGNLRPQFLDRFGLMVEVGAPVDAGVRTEVVRRRIAFEADAAEFASRWADNLEVIRTQVSKARMLLPVVQMPDGLLKMISQLCIEWGVGSLRADIVMYKTAVTIAAFNGRTLVTANDIREAAGLVLTHRKGKKTVPPQIRQPSEESPEMPNGEQTHRDSDIPGQGETDSPADGCGEENCDDNPHEQIADVDFGMNVPELNGNRRIERADLPDGRSARAGKTVTGLHVRSVKSGSAADIAVTDTVLHALSRNPDALHIGKADLHQKVRNGRVAHLILFVVDASGSMAAGKRMEAVKGAVINLLQEAYQRRNMVGVIAFRGVEATILLEPTRDIEAAGEALRLLPTGGRTPLPHALQLAEETFSRHTGSGTIPFLVILSDGKANVPLPGADGDAWSQSLYLAGKSAHRALVLDTESGYVRYGKAKQLAEALEADYLPLEDLSAWSITETVSARLLNSRNE